MLYSPLMADNEHAGHSCEPSQIFLPGNEARDYLAVARIPAANVAENFLFCYHACKQGNHDRIIRIVVRPDIALALPNFSASIGHSEFELSDRALAVRNNRDHSAWDT